MWMNLSGKLVNKMYGIIIRFNGEVQNIILSIFINFILLFLYLILSLSGKFFIVSVSLLIKSSTGKKQISEKQNIA